MRLIFSLFFLAILGYGSWRLTSTHPEVKIWVEEWIDGGSFSTLEIRYTAEQIMNAHQSDLLQDKRYLFLEPTLKFYPYLLLDVKYSVSEDKTKESLILWDLVDGEMVIDTDDWNKTHGFGDCINASADKDEFKILNFLAKKGGSSDRATLAKALHADHEILDSWIESCRRKKLIVQIGNRYRLHLQNPQLRTSPQTRISERLVTKPFKHAIRASKKYSTHQIERIAKAVFDSDFSIKNATDIYLPIHCISVQNPDGSIHTTHWNALNGKPLVQSHFID